MTTPHPLPPLPRKLHCTTQIKRGGVSPEPKGVRLKLRPVMKNNKISWEIAYPPLTPYPLSHASGERGERAAMRAEL